jgi:transcriptional regulator with XRE-family HTH domain
MGDEKREDLADFVKRTRKEKGLSLADVARRSGGEIAKSTISQIENRYGLNVTKDSLKALAIGLGVPEEAVFAVARGATNVSVEEFKQSVFYELYQKLPLLDERTRDHIETAIIRLNKWAEEVIPGVTKDQISKRRKRS